jgi:hypothetical protein
MVLWLSVLLAGRIIGYFALHEPSGRLAIALLLGATAAP